MKTVFLVAFWACLAGCASLNSKVLEETGPVAQVALREGDFVAAKMIRRLVDGNLLVRLPENQVVMLGPKETCSWCWMYLSRTVYVELKEQSAVLLSPKGERIDCWNGGPVDAY